MSNVLNILKYQEKDKALFALEKELASSKERKEYVQAKKFLSQAAEKLDLLDAKGKQLKGAAAELTKKYLEAVETLSDFEHIDELLENGGGEIAFYKKNALALSDKLKKLKAELNELTATINATHEEFQKLKKQVILMQKQGKEAQEKYKVVEESKKEEKEAIEKELAALAKEVPANVMEIYLTKRKEKIFPVIGQLKNGRCPYCGMEPPLASVNALSGGNTIECDDCHRVIYGQ